MMLWLVIVGCGAFSPPLQVARLEPTEATPGESVRLVGQGIDARTRVRWVAGEDVHEGVLTPSGDTWTTTAPNLPPGTYTLELVEGSERATAEFRVLGPPPEEPCKRGYQANTQVSGVDGIAVIDRFYADGRRERETIQLADVERLELQRGDGDCAAIFLRLADGSSVLFEDGTAELDSRAETLSRYMGKPLKR